MWRKRLVTVDAAWRGWGEVMNSNEEKARAAIAEQAGEWFLANKEGPLDARDAAALAAWFKASPVHIEEFLGVSAVARDLQQARSDPDYSVEAILARARAEDEISVKRLWPRATETVRGRPLAAGSQPSRPWPRSRRWPSACCGSGTRPVIKRHWRPTALRPCTCRHGMVSS